MDDALRQDLFDPDASHDLVLGRRPCPHTAVRCVVSDVVWGEVVCLLRWANAGTGGSAALRTGTWWRLAAHCAALLRRFPALSAEIDEPWCTTPPVHLPGATGAERVDAAAARLAALLRSPEQVPLCAVAAEIDALGGAAVTALAEHAVCTVPATARGDGAACPGNTCHPA
jgi:hypothetical protein